MLNYASNITFFVYDAVGHKSIINDFNSRYNFSAKEKPARMNIRSGGHCVTQHSYFTERYYDSDLSIWLNVDPMIDAKSSV